MVALTLQFSDRYELEDEIERLIDMLDTIDPDPDLEPSLGDTPYCRNPATVDLEGDSADDEADLGWTEMEARFGRYALGSDQLQPSNDEFSLGSLGAINQERWSAGRADDLEHDHDGREPCCEDEGAQWDDEGFQWF
jgi:hypothetical protein